MTAPIVHWQRRGILHRGIVLAAALVGALGARPALAAENVTLQNVTFQIRQATVRLPAWTLSG